MKPTIKVDRVLVANVKAFTDRRKSIEQQMSRLGIPFEFMLDGDIPDITPDLKQRWFRSPLTSHPKSMSCTCKHFLIYEKMAQQGWNGVLVLEDDIFLADNFVDIFNRTQKELLARTDIDPEWAWISYENSGLRFPRQNTLTAGRYLYQANALRCTGAYYIGARAADYLLNVAEVEKADTVIDCYIENVMQRPASLIEVYWCHPTIAEQGSMNGSFDSMDPRRRATWWRKVQWHADKLFKTVKHRWAS